MENEGIMTWHSAGALTGWEVEDVGSSLEIAAGDAWLRTFQWAGGEERFRDEFEEMFVVFQPVSDHGAVSGNVNQVCVPPTLPCCSFWEEMQNLLSLILSCCLERNKQEFKARRFKQVTYFRPITL